MIYGVKWRMIPGLRDLSGLTGVTTALLSAGGMTAEGVANTNAFEVCAKRSIREAAGMQVVLC